MTRYITDRGIQASAAAAVVLGVVTTVAYSPTLLIVWAVWAVWAGVAVWATGSGPGRHA